MKLLCSATPYDGFEIAPVAEYRCPGWDNATCERFETLAEAQEAADEHGGIVFWTLYGHTSGQGLTAITDATLEGCAHVLSALLGQVVEVNTDGATLMYGMRQ